MTTTRTARARRAGTVLAIAAVAAALGPSPVRAAPPAPRTPATAATAARSPGAAGGHVAWGLGPSTKRAVDGRPAFKWFVTPGAVLHDHVAVVNLGFAPLALDLYARAATNGVGGRLALQPRSEPPTGAASWITLALPGRTSSVTVPARSTVIVPITLHVPHRAAPGDYTAGVISSLTAKVQTGSGENVNPDLEQRIAVPAAVRVSGPVHPRLSVEALGSTYHGTLDPVGRGRATLRYRVVNTGNVNLGGRQRVSVSGPLGVHVGVPAGDLPVLLPGGSMTVQLQVRGVFPELVMSAHVAITPLVPSGDVDPGAAVARAGAHFWAIPWLLLAILAAVGLFAWLAVRAWRARRAHPGDVRAVRGRRRPAIVPGVTAPTSIDGASS